MKDSNWYEMLEAKFKRTGDDFSKMKASLSNEVLKTSFDRAGFENGGAFTAWGDRYVYFPLCYDGLAWVGCAPRNPCEISMETKSDNPKKPNLNNYTLWRLYWWDGDKIDEHFIYISKKADRKYIQNIINDISNREECCGINDFEEQLDNIDIEWKHPNIEEIEF